MKKPFSILMTSCIFREIRVIRLIRDSKTGLPVSLWLKTLKLLTTNHLTPIVSPLKRFVKHLNPIIIKHLRTVSLKMKFLRFDFSTLIGSPYNRTRPLRNLRSKGLSVVERSRNHNRKINN